MKTLVKIVCATMLTGCFSFNLYAQQENMYYVEFQRNSLRVETSSGGCGDDYHYLEFSVIDTQNQSWPVKHGQTTTFGGYGMNEQDFPGGLQFISSSIQPKTITLLGKAGDESDNYDEHSAIWQYEKGDNKRTMSVNPSQSRCGLYCCTRSLYAAYTVIVDDPVDVTCDSSKSNSSSFASATEKLTLRVGNFYKNGKAAPVLQVNINGNNNTWVDVRSVSPNEVISLSYDDIVEMLKGKSNVNFDDLFGRRLSFRVLKTLLDNTQTCGKSTKGVVFYPDGIKFSITNTRQKYCEDNVILTVHLENPDDARYMKLDTNNSKYHWAMALKNGGEMAFDCTMSPLVGNKFQIIPRLDGYDPPRKNPFMEEEDTFWQLQLQERENKAVFYCTQEFTIPAKPGGITVAQMAPVPPITVSGSTYHLPHRGSIYALLNITDPSYESHHRVPYYVDMGDGHTIPVWELGAAAFEDLGQAKQDSLQNVFDTTYKKEAYTAARLNFANTQQGLVLPEKAGRIAMPDDGSFFLYTQANGSNVYNLYRAMIVDGKAARQEQLTAGENILEMEVTPDGAYCIYTKYNTAGVFMLPLTGTFPASGTLLSGKADATIVSTFGEEFPNHIYKTASGSWAFVSLHNSSIYSITIPDGTETVIMAKPASVSHLSQVFVTGNGDLVYYEFLSSSDPYPYDVIKKNIETGAISTISSNEDAIQCDLTNPVTSTFRYYYTDKYPSTTYFHPNHSNNGNNGIYYYFDPLHSLSDFYDYDYSSTYSYACPEGDHAYFSNNYNYNTPYIREMGDIVECYTESSNIKIECTTLRCFTNITKNTFLNFDHICFYDEKIQYTKVCPSPANFKIADVAADGSFVIVPRIGTSNTIYRALPEGMNLFPLGSNYKVNPITKNIVFSHNGNTYKNTTTAENLLTDKKSSNICFSGNGRYFLFVDPVTSYVHKQYMSTADALDDTEPLFRQSQWEQFLNKQLGTRVDCPHIEFPMTDSLTWTLTDADGCAYPPFKVFITAPENPDMNSVVKSPSSQCAYDGAATITYKGGGAPPYLYGTGELKNIGDKIIVYGLRYGDSTIQFTDALGRESFEYIVTISGGAGITDTEVTRHQTCDSPDGRIKIIVANLPGNKTYRIVNTAYPYNEHTYPTDSDNYEFQGIPAGRYEVSVSQGDCYFEKAEKSTVESRIFKIKDIVVTHAATLKGTGSATITFENFDGTAEWAIDGGYSNSSSVDKITINNLDPGMHEFSVSNNTGCMVKANITIEKPDCWGTINFHYTTDSLQIATNSLNENKWFEPYKFRIIKSTGEIVIESKKPNVVIRQPGDYELYACYTQIKDSLLLHEFTFPVDTIRANVGIVPPDCPQDKGTATVNISGGGFGTASAIRISRDKWDYSPAKTFTLEASQYDAWLRDTIVHYKDGLLIYSELLQPLSFEVPAMEPVSAQVNYASPLCAGSSDGWIRLSDFTGGSGEYEYKINNGEWQDIAFTTRGLEPGTYNVFLRDKTYPQCEEQVLQPVTLRAPAALSVDVITVAHTTCELDNGALAAQASGGMPPYTYTLRSMSSSYTSEQGSTTGTVSFSGLEGAQQYEIAVKDAHGCVATTTPQMINGYTNPSITGIHITDVSCYGESNGRVAASLGQGTSPIDSAVLYTEDYSFRERNGSGVFEQLSAGVYKMDVYDHKGCKSKDVSPVSVNEPAAALTATTTRITDVLCNGKATGILEYAVSGGTSPYKIELSGAAMREQTGAGASCTFDNLPAGTYTAKITDHNSCAYTVSAAMIQQPPPLALSYISTTHTSCELGNGVLAAQAIGGVAPYTYKLSVLDGSYAQVQTLSSVDTACFSNLAGAIDYQLEIIDNYGCIVSCAEMINGYKNPSISAATVTDVSCFGENNGKVELSLMQGNAPVQMVQLYTPDYSFDQDNLPGIFEGLSPGNYQADVYDQNGCKSNVSYSVLINEPALLHVLVDTIVPAIAKGARSGKINFKVQGGNEGNKTIVLQQNDATVDNLSAISNVPLSFTEYAGTYVLQVTDTKGCQFTTGILQIEEPADSLRLVLKDVQDALCKSQVGSITVEGTGGWGGYRYKRASDQSFTALNTFDKLYPGDYVITVIDRLGGTYSETITVHEPKDSLQAVVTAQELPACGNNGALSINITGGTPPYMLYENADTSFYPQPQQVRLTGKSSGDYLLHLVDNNGCRFELEAHLSAAALLTVDGLTVQHPSLPASSDGLVTVIVHGGTEPYTYRWTQDITLSLPVNAPALTGIPAGYYGVEVTDAKGCTAQATAMLLNPSDVSFTLVELGHETSFGAVNGYAVLYPDVPLSNYELITPAPAKYVYTDADSTATFHTRNDTVFLHGLSGGKWILSGNNAEGQYCVLELVIHPYKEFGITNVTVMHARRPGDTTGQVRIDVQGGGGNNKFTWKKILPAFQEEVLTNTQILSEEYSSLLHDIPAGLYAVQVEDRYGNILQQEITIEEPEQALAASIGNYQNQSCKTYQDAYVVLSVGGGWGDYQFRHSSEQHFSNSAIFQYLETGEHTFYIIDRYGVIDSVKVSISEPDYLHASVALVDSITCKNAADGRILFNLTGGVAPYSLSELNSQIWRDGTIAGNIPAGYHTFVFTDKNTCVGLDTLTVYMPEPDSLLFKDITVIHTTCGEDNGKIAVSMQGGMLPYDYRWKNFNGTVIGNDTLVSGLQKNALYDLTVTDRNGCIQQLTQQINSSSLPAITGLQTTPVLCYGDTTGTALITAISPASPYAPYALVWSNGEEGNFSGKFQAGTHSVTLTDTNGCVATRYFTIAQPDPLTITATQIKAPNCYGFSDGYIHTRSEGGVGDYSYEWSTGAVMPHVDNLVKGDYHVKLTDANGCMTTQVFTVSQPDTVILIVKDIKLPDCYGYTNGYILTEARGGVGGYQYNWSTGAVTSGISNLAAGEYHLELQDANGCTIDTIFILSQPDILALTATGIKEPSCYGFNDGYILTEGQGGVGGYQYNWSTGATTPDIKELVKGNYSLVFSDANGCSLIRYFDIAQPDLLQLAATDVRDPHCFGYNDGHILTETTGGVSAYTYEWSTGATTPDIENLVKGNYHVLLTDANGCTYQKSFTLDEPAYQWVDLGKDVIMCPGNTHLLDGGDYAAYRWYTAGGDIFNERYLRVTEEENYFLEATDTRGCPAWGEVSVTIGDNALTADFLLPSEAPLGDTIIAIELSNLPLDSLQWNYNQQIFERLWPDNDYNQPYILHLRSLQTGIYNVTLYAYTGGCYAQATKQIEIIEPGASGTQPTWGYQESLITSLELYPNPTGGFFNVVITLREAADVTLTLFEVASGARTSVRTERGMSYYYLTYEIPQLNSGFYVLIVTAGKERRQVTIVVEK